MSACQEELCWLLIQKLMVSVYLQYVNNEVDVRCLPGLGNSQLLTNKGLLSFLTSVKLKIKKIIK